MKDNLFRVGIRVRNELGSTTLRYKHFIVTSITTRKEIPLARIESRRRP